MTDFVHEGRRSVINIVNPTITERAAHVLGRYFRPVGQWVTGDRQRPREVPPAFHDASHQGYGAPRSHIESYIERQQRLGRRNYSMADAHAKGGDHGGGDMATKALVGALALFIFVATIIWFFNWLNGPSRTYTVIDNTPAQVQIVRQPPAVVTINGQAPQVIVRGSMAPPDPYAGLRGGTTVSGPPSPQQVYESQLAAGNVTKVRVPCAPGFDTLPNGNCGRWVPN